MPTLDERIEAAKAIEPPQEQWFAVQPTHANGWWVVSTDPAGNYTVDASGDGGFEEDTSRFIAAAPDTLALALDLAAERERLLDENERMREALALARRSHGVVLPTDPPQDAWKARQVDAVIAAALAPETRA